MFMMKHFGKMSVMLASSAAIVSCNNGDVLSPDDQAIGAEVQAAMTEASAPPIFMGADITPGTIEVNGTTMNAIAVQMVGNTENGSDNAFRVVAWVPAADTTQHPPFDQFLRVGIKTRESADVPVGVTVPITGFDRDAEQSAFADFKDVTAGARWEADTGAVTVDAFEITGEATACTLPEGIDVPCTVAIGTAAGSFEFTATQRHSDGTEQLVVGNTAFSLPAVQIVVEGGFGWHGFRKGHGRGCGWGFDK